MLEPEGSAGAAFPRAPGAASARDAPASDRPGAGETPARAGAAIGKRGLRDRAAALVPERAGPGLVAVATACAVALYLGRSGASALHPQFVAEDGPVFFMDAKLQGLPSLWTPYAGYLHVLPRLAALAASAFPSPRAPDLYLLFAAAIVAWAAATIAATGQRHAWVLAPLALMVPTDGEVFGTLTNVQWLTGPALALVIATPPPPGRLARANQVAFASLAGLTGPFSVFIAPVAAWRLWQDRTDAFARLLCGGVLVAAAVQFGLVMRAPKLEAGFEAPLHFAVTLLDRWIGQAAHPGRTFRPVHLRDIAALVAAAAVSAAAVPRVAARLYLFAVLSLLATFGHFIGHNSYFDHPGAAERYFYGPRLVVLWVLALCLLRLRPSSVAGLVGIVLMVAAVDPWVKEPYPNIPWATPAEDIDRGLPVRIVINPSDAGDPTPNAWAVTMPGRPRTEASPPR